MYRSQGNVAANLDLYRSKLAADRTCQEGRCVPCFRDLGTANKALLTATGCTAYRAALLLT